MSMEEQIDQSPETPAPVVHDEDTNGRGEAPSITYGVNPSTNLFHGVWIKTDKPHNFKPHERLASFGATSNEVQLLSDYYPNQDIGTSEAAQQWGELSAEASRHQIEGAVYGGVLSRPGSSWSNSIRAEGGQLQIGRPKIEKTDGEKLVGEAAMMRVQAVMGLGSTQRVPLWHSGLWVTLKAPSDTALLELERRIAADKIQLGRSTSGLVFSSANVYIMDHVVDFALAHVMEATYRYSDISELKAKIDTTDIYLLIHGLLCTMYPNGYPYAQPCVVDPTKCTHILTELVSLPRLCFTDQMRLTERQLKHMSRRTAKFTDEELKAYRDDHTFLGGREVKLTENISMMLRVPTIENYRQIGTSWVDGITTKVERSFAASIPPKEREAYIISQAQVTSMCQYAHWIEKIVISDGEITQEIVDPNTITDTLATIGANSEAYKNYYEGMQKFIAESTISLIAVPKVPCPNCGKEHVNADPANDKHPHLLPLDMINVFFTLQNRRLTTIFTNDA